MTITTTKKTMTTALVQEVKAAPSPPPVDTIVEVKVTKDDGLHSQGMFDLDEEFSLLLLFNEEQGDDDDMGLSWLFMEVVPDLGMIEEDREQGDYDDMGLSLLFTEVVPEFAYGHLPPRVFRRRVVFKIKKREARLPLVLRFRMKMMKRSIPAPLMNLDSVSSLEKDNERSHTTTVSASGKLLQTWIL